MLGVVSVAFHWSAEKKGGGKGANHSWGRGPGWAVLYLQRESLVDLRERQNAL